LADHVATINMFHTEDENVAIIGAGIAGLSMALTLQSLSINCTVYEARNSHLAPRTSGGAMMLSPNAFRVMDRLGVYERIKQLGYPFQHIWYKNGNEETIDKYPMGSETAYGYDAMRIYRQELLEALYSVCAERGVPIVFNKKFVKIVDESAVDGVTLAFEDGEIKKAVLLIGADGIHSRVRAYIAPEVQPKFMGLAALTWVTPTKDIRVPDDKDYRLPVSVLTSNGVLVLAPQRRDGSEMFTGTQFAIEDQGRDGWDALLADKETLVARARKNMDAWPDIAKSSIENLDPDTFNLWPYRMLPPLENWTSPTHRRVVILGDAAHAFPPTTGQGASQAFEDVLSLGLLVSNLREHSQLKWEEVLGFWQQMRQTRLHDLLDLTRRLNNKRLPLEKQATLDPGDLWVDETETNPDQMAWLYKPMIEERVQEWVDSKLGSA
jgi:2-polyprenyl-6-methoxyphenol hydroxylase-like FAD-dependent oxidoreductase